jgi:uncharacterized membrane protein
MDEAWVANSILTENIAGMFYYDSWLQTTPPLYLLLARLTVFVFGTSNTAFRTLSSLLGILLIFNFIILSKNIFKQPYAFLFATLMLVNRLVFYNSHTLKPYVAN